MTEIRADIERFRALAASESYTSADFFEESGIGIYNEKRLHKILKRTLCERESCYEIKIGRYVADICDDGVISEIQCGSLLPLCDKLRYYLDETEYDVCIVHPLVAKRRIIKANKETGEVLSRRLSPKKESEWDGLASLYPIREFLSSPRVSVRFMFVELEEYRFSERMRYRREGAYDSEVFPTELVGCLDLNSPEDYTRFLPNELCGREFSVNEYSALTGVRGMDAYSVLNLLSALGITERKKQGRRVSYKS